MAKKKSSLPLGTISILASSFVLAATGIAGRGLSEHTTVAMIVFFQGIVGGLIAGSALMMRRGPRGFLTRHWFLNLMRTLTGLGAYIVFFWSLKHVTTAEAVVLLNTAPFFLLFYKRFWQKERVVWLAWVMVLVGFGGLCLLVFHDKASIGSVNPFLLVALSGGVFLAMTGIVMHALAGRETVTYSTMFYCALVTIGFLPFVIYDFALPNWFALWLLLGTGVGFTLRAYTLQLANYLMQPYLVAMLAYSGVIFAAFGDWAFFKDVPNFLQIAGMAVIAISGAFIITIEARAKSREGNAASKVGKCAAQS